MTVQKLFTAEKIDRDFISDMMCSQGDEYWESCYNFVSMNWEREIETMSQRQAAWLTKILDDCVEKRIEG